MFPAVYPAIQETFVLKAEINVLAIKDIMILSMKKCAANAIIHG